MTFGTEMLTLLEASTFCGLPQELVILARFLWSYSYRKPYSSPTLLPCISNSAASFRKEKELPISSGPAVVVVPKRYLPGAHLF